MDSMETVESGHTRSSGGPQRAVGSSISFRGVTKRYAGKAGSSTLALESFDLEIPASEIFSIVG